MHGENRNEQSNVASAIYAEDAKSVFHRRRPSLEKRDQQNRGDPNNLPACGKQVERIAGIPALDEGMWPRTGRSAPIAPLPARERATKAGPQLAPAENGTLPLRTNCRR